MIFGSFKKKVCLGKKLITWGVFWLSQIRVIFATVLFVCLWIVKSG